MDRDGEIGNSVAMKDAMPAVTDTIAMFFEDIGFQSQGKDRGAAYRQDLLRTIDFHVETFAVHGWRVVPVGMEEARRHPLYPWFDGLDSFYALSRNGPTYTRICYMRWLAYATAGLPFADLDVMNFGFTPEDAVPLLASERPALISAANAMGLLTPEHYARILDDYRHVIEHVDDFRTQVEDVNDMTLLRAARPEYNMAIPYTDDRFVKDYSNPGWETARLVHFPHGLTPQPRSRTIETVIQQRARDL